MLFLKTGEFGYASGCHFQLRLPRKEGLFEKLNLSLERIAYFKSQLLKLIYADYV